MTPRPRRSCRPMGGTLWRLRAACVTLTTREGHRSKGWEDIRPLCAAAFPSERPRVRHLRE